MLTIEEIKKAVEFADGFEISGEKLMYKGRLCDFKQWIESYDLFLDRVIQGICKRYNGRVFQDWNAYSLIIEGKQSASEYNGTTEGIREAREKAIRFVLEGMR